jgi:hypothetical protein
MRRSQLVERPDFATSDRSLRIFMDGAYLRPLTASIATSTRICAVIWIIVPIPASHEEDLPSQVRMHPSTEYASCCQSRTRTRSRTPKSTPNEKRSVRQTPAKRPSWKQSQLHQAASSIAHSPTAEGVQPHASHVAGQAPSRIAIATQAASSDAHGCLETAPVRVEVEQLVRE